MPCLEIPVTTILSLERHEVYLMVEDWKNRQARCGLGFTAETLQSLGVLGEFFRQEFQGYKTVEAGVFGLVDDAHAATAELLHDAVVRDGLADQPGARSGRPY